MPIPDNLICPITQEIMEDPVNTNCNNQGGHTFDKEAITAWSNSGINKKCPLCRGNIHPLTPNIDLKNQIDEFNLNNSSSSSNVDSRQSINTVVNSIPITTNSNALLMSNSSQPRNITEQRVNLNSSNNLSQARDVWDRLRREMNEDADGTFARLSREMNEDADGTFARLKREMQ